MGRGFVIEPKEDMTAFELAHIIMIVQSTHDPKFMRQYLKEKCPEAIRHMPGWSWTEEESFEIKERIAKEKVR